MSKDTDRPAKRGEARWKEVREGVARSNDEVRRAGKKDREAFDRIRRDARAKSRQAPHGD